MKKKIQAIVNPDKVIHVEIPVDEKYFDVCYENGYFTITLTGGY